MKIFGLGLTRTGTASLNEALIILGYKSIHFPADSLTLQELQQGKYKLTILEYYDAITDIVPIPFYRHFQQLYDCKFILTTRNLSSWLVSITRHMAYFTDVELDHLEKNISSDFIKMTRFICPLIYGEDWRHAPFEQIYENHHQQILRDIPNVLTLNISAGEGWDKLCPYLGCPIPKTPFPHLNKWSAPKDGNI